MPADLLAAAQLALAHVEELRGAWERGALHERDGGTRSNRNVEVEVALRRAIEAVKRWKEEHGWE